MTQIMIGWSVVDMTTLTIYCSGCVVIEYGLTPGGGVMAGGTLTTEVVGGSVFTMAGLAICRPCHGVIEADIFPSGGRMTC